ncbi:MAG TPA: hypothetical protein VHB25_10545 [Gemmatimonadaceae bacterium]|nr:hypothetical protein [Gemmatimonadaceae bacterium]
MTTVSILREEPRADVGLLAATAVLVALLDGTFAMAFYSVLLHRVVTGGIWRSIASHVLGPAALHGGASAAMVGVLIHVTVATGWTVLFYVALRTTPALARAVRARRAAAAVGAFYGMIIWLSMQYAVVPLGHGAPASPATFNFWAMLAWHAAGVGPPIALMLRRIVPERS